MFRRVKPPERDMNESPKTMMGRTLRRERDTRNAPVNYAMRACVVRATMQSAFAQRSAGEGGEVRLRTV